MRIGKPCSDPTGIFAFLYAQRREGWGHIFGGSAGIDLMAAGAPLLGQALSGVSTALRQGS